MGLHPPLLSDALVSLPSGALFPSLVRRPTRGGALGPPEASAPPPRPGLTHSPLGPTQPTQRLLQKAQASNPTLLFFAKAVLLRSLLGSPLGGRSTICPGETSPEPKATAFPPSHPHQCPLATSRGPGLLTSTATHTPATQPPHLRKYSNVTTDALNPDQPPTDLQTCLCFT